MQKLYVIAYKSDVDLEDCLFAINWDMALELLGKSRNQKQIIEYTFDSNGVAMFWNAFHFYRDGILVSENI